jgi:predicted esterase
MSPSALYSTTTDENPTAPKNIIRILALHGSGGTGESMKEKTLNRWNELLTATAGSTSMHDEATSANADDDACVARSSSSPVVELQISTVEGHEPKEEGFAWWYLPPGERSSTATHYDGFEVSQSTVLEALSDASSSSERQPLFDVILGHSQGAILITALLALQSISQQQHPRIGYILNGVAWPNPYTVELESLRVDSATTTSGEQQQQMLPPRVLIVIGERDTINTPDQAFRVATALEKAGYRVTTLTHPGGHAVPIRNDETWEAIHSWLVETL